MARFLIYVRYTTHLCYITSFCGGALAYGGPCGNEVGSVYDCGYTAAQEHPFRTEVGQGMVLGGNKGLEHNTMVGSWWAVENPCSLE